MLKDKLNRLHFLDALRFIAASMVVFYHYFYFYFLSLKGGVDSSALLVPSARYGFLGVYLFFMISGYVISISVLNSKNIINFAVSRAVRLYPTFLICCSITVILALVFNESVGLLQYFLNIIFLGSVGGAIDGTYWTLAVELRFYILISLVFLFNPQRHIFAFMVFWIFVCLILHVMDFFNINIRLLNIVFMPNYSPFFISGALLCMLNNTNYNGRKVFFVALMSSLIFSYILSLYAIYKYITDVDYNLIAVLNLNISTVYALVSLFYLLISLTEYFSKFIDRKYFLCVSILGGTTYPLYLLHERIGFMIFNGFFNGSAGYALIYITMFLIFFVSLFVHTMFERRFSFLIKNKVHVLISKIGIK
ncbi:MAG: acyltransferase [Proteobacteria bacterium]|nr:acyltransferase [Pseudomonadota bacterium]